MDVLTAHQDDIRRFFEDPDGAFHSLLSSNIGQGVLLIVLGFPPGGDECAGFLIETQGGWPIG